MPTGPASICLKRAGMSDICVTTTIGPGVTRWDFSKDAWKQINVIE
jgi:hypothetical protein